MTRQEEYEELARLTKLAEEAAKAAIKFAKDNDIDYGITSVANSLDFVKKEGWEYSQRHWSDDPSWVASQDC